MPRSLDPLNKTLGPYRARGADKREIAIRAYRAHMTEAEYVRERALGKSCPPKKGPPPPGLGPPPEGLDTESEGDDE